MLQLHFQGIVYDLYEDQSVADVVNFMDNYTRAQNGSVNIKLADGSFAYVKVGASPTYVVVSPPGYQPEGLKVSRSGPPGGTVEGTDQHAEMMDLLERRLGEIRSTLEGIEASVMGLG